MLTIGSILDGRYHIRELIGDGGYGSVYLAYDSRFSGNNFVAIKMIPQTSANHNKSFRREADLLYNLNHPNLPKVSNCFQQDQANFIVMDFISGDDLAVSLKKGKVFSVAEVTLIADKVLDALEYLHSFTIFHRDIKPHNIKIDSKGNIFLLDFGAAKGYFDEATVTRNEEQSITAYTPFYAPLEQVLRIDPNSYYLLYALNSPNLERFTDSKTDARSDIYSLGATLYYLLTRNSPEKATATIRAHALWSGKPDTLQPIDETVDGIPAGLAVAIHRSLEIEPEKRFQTAGEFRRAIHDLQSEYLTRYEPALPDTEENFVKIEVVPPIGSVGDNKQFEKFPSKAEFVVPLKKNPAEKSKLPIYVAALILCFLAAIGGIFLAVKMIPQREISVSENLTYSLLVQKMRDGKEYQTPFESSGQEIFENGYKFKLRFSFSGEGFCYIFAEGLNSKNERIYNVIFPTPNANNGKSDVTADRQYETGWNVFGGNSGTENFWIIRSRKKSDIAEKSLENGFLNQSGEVTDNNLVVDLKRFIQEHNKSDLPVKKDSEKKLSKVEVEGDVVTYLIQLEHR